MADLYCDHGAYGDYAATPTWGMCQEGDGLQKTLATSATCSIDLTEASFTSGSSSLAVLGVNIAITASANASGNAQYNATLTTMIDNIAAAINATTTGIVTRPANWRGNQLRDTVFARRSGNLLQLMTRAGSALYNGMVAVVWSNSAGASDAAFDGGVSGAWGYIANQATTIWPSALPMLSYGIWSYSVTAIAGYLAPGDRVFVRNNNKALTLGSTDGSNNSNTTGFRFRPMGSESQPVRFIVDDGTVWAGDPPDAILTLQTTRQTASSLWSLARTEQTPTLRLRRSILVCASALF